MKKEIRQVTWTEDKAVFIAFDGKEFKTEKDCRLYEKDKYREKALARIDVEINEELNGQAPMHYGYIDNDDTYIWVRPLSDEAEAELQRAYDGAWLEGAFIKNKWMCICIDNYDEVYLLSEDELIKNTAEQFEKMGYRMKLHKI